MKQKSNFAQVAKLLSREEKRTVFFLFLLSILVSIVETVGLSSIIPFVDISMAPDRVFENKKYNTVYTYLNFESPLDFIIVLGLLLIAFFLFRGMLNLFFAYQQNKFANERYASFVNQLTHSYLDLSYEDFTAENSTQYTKALITETTYLSAMITAMLSVISESLIFIFLYGMILFVNPEITLALTVLVGGALGFTMKKITRKMEF